ncbi:hypothetical protein [Dysgonomonas gadei]|uniref:Uncharacterized protein n=1 Tax=Dysgonomonas gadei ATCC BAA-286 TaxID=742766 RepID=F5J1C0_9BACT|nr:hypothetical protein [Dysgonomonas gadei]EGK00494.1 hypothetical protein HMPREF9455_03137 [Dysgonomonas gadei ATCC BAA-286]
MRNSEYLDNKQPEDDLISELMIDDDGRPYRIVDGKKIFQIEENTQHDIDLNLILNRYRITGR